MRRIGKGQEVVRQGIRAQNHEVGVGAGRHNPDVALHVEQLRACSGGGPEHMRRALNSAAEGEFFELVLVHGPQQIASETYVHSLLVGQR